VSDGSERLPWWPALAAALFGLALFLSQGGAVGLDVTRTDWMYPGSDWAYHLLGWTYFRDAAWSWPLGDIPGIHYPVGTTLVYMDAMPWIALPMKLLSPILPRPFFQFIGPWLCLCYFLAGWFGARLAQALGARPVAAAFAGAILALSPPLMERVIHEALMGHFLLYWALTVALSPRPRQTLVGAVLVPVIALGVHPYLLAMVFPICLTGLVRGALFDRIFSWQRALAVGGGMCVALVLLALMLGVGGGAFGMSGNGFSHYGTDVTTLVMTQGRSRFLPDMPGHRARWEGFGYLGLGGIALLVSAVYLAIWRRADLRWKRLVPLAVVLVGATLFALADPIRLLGKPLVRTNAFWDQLPLLTGAFRSSGRFIWPLFYALLAAGIALWARLGPRAAPVVFGVVLALQIADLKNGFFSTQFTKRYEWVERDPAWELVAGEYKHLVLFPPRCGDGSGTCCPNFTKAPLRPDTTQMMHSSRLGLTTNSTGVGRADRQKHAIACAELQAAVDGGKLDRETIYQIWGGLEGRFLQANPNVVCAMLDGAQTCVTADAPAAFRQALQRRRVR
jgi:Family of unknown function (DUF6311)